MLPSLSLPPLERCLGTSPIHAEKSRPDRKAFGSATLATRAVASEEQGDAVKGVLATNNPSKRMADPSEIAKLAVYLASDDSAYVVGADFLIDGGVTAISSVGA